MAFGLAVYASSSVVAGRRRKTRFRLLVRLCRTGFDPQGSIQRFQIISSSSAKLSWRNPGSTLEIKIAASDITNVSVDLGVTISAAKLAAHYNSALVGAGMVGDLAPPTGLPAVFQ